MKKKLLIGLSIGFGVLILLFASILITYPNMKINGKENITVELNSEYIEKEASIKTFLGKKKMLKTKDTVNTNKIGTYKIVYKTKYLFFEISKTRTVKVIDNISPVITLTGDEEINICPNKEFEELGYSATDNYDGDITNQVKIEKTDSIIRYIVSDSSKNTTIKERKINKTDTEKPIITLKGKEKITIPLSNKYSEPGYTAIDNCDGDITSSVVTSGSVNTDKTGEYKINYTVKDSSSNESTVTRTIIVKNSVEQGNNSVVYLTFDDGPSNLTPKILDILKEENVKATFFVINKSDSLNYIIKRAYDEGHKIALHSYSHDYNLIYSSSEAYFNDLYKIQNKVKSIIGNETNIIRFPGGSSNTVSNFNKGIMTKLTKEVTQKGFIYFDWNVSSGDAGATKNSDEIYNNVVNNVKSSKTNIVLMHDSADKTYTLNALKNIITTLKNNGYKFDKIDSDTPQIIHRVNN